MHLICANSPDVTCALLLPEAEFMPYYASDKMDSPSEESIPAFDVYRYVARC